MFRSLLLKHSHFDNAEQIDMLSEVGTTDRHMRLMGGVEGYAMEPATEAVLQECRDDFEDMWSLDFSDPQPPPLAPLPMQGVHHL